MTKNGPAVDGTPTTTAKLERVTVNLTQRAARALEEAVELSGDSKTDIINRALQVYAYLERIDHDGGKVYVHDPDQEHPERLRFF
ncbi:hypothetical protein ACIBHY_51580 [Nonomuraea sp. NPDC050547]|uniref:hypothetical protein n=1 Tax=unclassified Nonomuraea TaxID=2593643 RepID=UPI003481BCB1